MADILANGVRDMAVDKNPISTSPLSGGSGVGSGVQRVSGLDSYMGSSEMSMGSGASPFSSEQDGRGVVVAKVKAGEEALKQKRKRFEAPREPEGAGGAGQALVKDQEMMDCMATVGAAAAPKMDYGVGNLTGPHGEARQEK
jgi:hypothetical protein